MFSEVNYVGEEILQNLIAQTTELAERQKQGQMQ